MPYTHNNSMLRYDTTDLLSTPPFYENCFCLQGFRVEAIWGRTNEEAAATAFALDIPFATNRIDDVLLRKDVDLILILCSPLHHSQIAVKALGNQRHDPNTVMI